MQAKRILVCPLDWGLGHATRCIPVIRKLQEQGAEVIIGADNGPQALLKQELPGLEFVSFPGYKIHYPKNGNMLLYMAGQGPKIIRGVNKEHNALENIIKDTKAHAVISDNRFGLWSDKVPCVFMTHQLAIQAPAFKDIIHRINNNYISRFDWCWVPDFESGNNLSGELGHPKKLPEQVRFIGPLSRFSPAARPLTQKYDVAIILSGPEPQRTIFEDLVLEQLRQTELSALVVQGLPHNKAERTCGKIIVYSHLLADKLRGAILSSKIVVSRPGYSTIMDMASLGKRAIFVPTPGQTEQEYLAKYHMKKGHFFSVKQKQFDLRHALAECENYTGINMKNDGALLARAVKELLGSLT